ncbi:hypothetical protein ASE21_12890 [Flavobacterium sp. Root901]|nr:hypothetical protein ASE21_12890 [Flavobacterium sp. Root901]
MQLIYTDLCYLIIKNNKDFRIKNKIIRLICAICSPLCNPFIWFLLTNNIYLKSTFLSIFVPLLYNVIP